MSDYREQIAEVVDRLEHLAAEVEQATNAIRENTAAVMAGVMLRIAIAAKSPAYSDEGRIDIAHRALQDGHEALVRFNHEPERQA